MTDHCLRLPAPGGRRSSSSKAALFLLPRGGETVVLGPGEQGAPLGLSGTWAASVREDSLCAVGAPGGQRRHCYVTREVTLIEGCAAHASSGR